MATQKDNMNFKMQEGNFYINRIFVFLLKRSLKDAAKGEKRVRNDTDIN